MLPLPQANRGAPALLHVEVGRELSDRIGLEYKLDDINQPECGITERDFLDALVNAGVATRDTRTALLQWPGSSIVDEAVSGWRLHRKVNSIKLVWDRERMSAKAYLRWKCSDPYRLDTFAP